MKTIKIALASLLCVGLGVAIATGPAQAIADTMNEPDSFLVTCADSATRIQRPGAVAGRFLPQSSYTCMSLDATEVYVGDSAVTTAIGQPFCTTAANCPAGAMFGADIGHEFCIVASGTISIRCRAGTK